MATAPSKLYKMYKIDQIFLGPGNRAPEALTATSRTASIVVVATTGAPHGDRRKALLLVDDLHDCFSFLYIQPETLCTFCAPCYDYKIPRQGQ